MLVLVGVCDSGGEWWVDGGPWKWVMGGGGWRWGRGWRLGVAVDYGSVGGCLEHGTEESIGHRNLARARLGGGH